MSSTTEALALYDTANQIDRLNFHLRALDRGPVVPSLSEVSLYVHTLATITLSVSDHVKHRLTDGRFAADGKKAVEAYSAALPPLGEAVTELGRAQAEIAHFNFTTRPAHLNNSSVLKHSRLQAGEIITGCFEAADEILKSVADDLRTSAGRLAASPAHANAHAHAQATARSPHASRAGQSAPGPATPPSPAPSAVAPGTAKGR
ncbi:hypothetical protein [Actinacidiphila paucisporea]|uniref:Uncharacterized protein n=1 Tax=Actinacidiphila paucisporea TaxID=310782 RepID=A0A1M7PZ23_9ACTN|nr:hypothetical protein [Actinacidiphila paucisporea]SHN23094.1 hypothetical protein SAMN05216499_12774 [Actinacidiphila paucisporea]